MSTTTVNSWTSRHLYWLLQVAGWGSYGILGASAAIVFVHLNPARVIAETAALTGTALLMTHGLRAVIKRQHWTSRGKVQLTLRVVGGSLIPGVVLGFMAQFTTLGALQDPEQLHGATPHLHSTLALANSIVNWTTIFVLWTAVYLVAVALRNHKSVQLRQSELTRALQLAELRLLKSQLNPHFMFNALNAVRSLIAEDPTRAQDAVTRLANTLRYTLTAGQDEIVTLSRELEIVEDYLELETLRFEDRLRVNCNVSAEARRVRIPVMMLQTLVENAIKHGIAALPEGGVLKIEGELQDGHLLLAVANPRPTAPVKSPAPESDGIGLRNAAERLRLLFGATARLDLDLSQPALATIRIRIPQSG
jgi:hypothetical protein